MLRIPVICVCVSMAMMSIAHGHGDVHERIEKLTQKYAQHPSDEILIRRARLYLEEGHADAARADLLKALEVAPGRYESFYYLAQANLMLKQHPEAMQAAERFIAKADSDAAQARGLVLRGDILMQAGQPLDAANVYVAALSRTPQADPEHFIKAADAFHAAGRSESLEVLEQGIARLGPLTTLQDRAVTIEMATGRHEAALRRIDAMLAANQRVPFLLYKKGSILRALGRPDRSEEALRQALREIENLAEERRRSHAVDELRRSIEQELSTARVSADTPVISNALRKQHSHAPE